MSAGSVRNALKDEPDENQLFRRCMDNPARGLPLSLDTLAGETHAEFRARLGRQAAARKASEREVFIPLPPNIRRQRRPQ